MIAYFFTMVHSFKSWEFSRGYVIVYAFATFCPLFNVGIAFVCGILMIGLLYEKLEVQKWMDEPFIKPRN